MPVNRRNNLARDAKFNIQQTQQEQHAWTFQKIEEQLVAKYADLDLSQKLPKELQAHDAGDHLYKIGAAFYKLHKETHRYRFHHPILILWLIGAIFLRSLITMLVFSSSQSMLLFWIGDISAIMNLRIHFNILLITYDYIIYGCIFLHFLQNRNFRLNGVLPNMKPFELSAGLVTPRHLGLKDKRKVVIFAKFAKSSFTFVKYMTRYFMNAFVFSAFFLVFTFRIAVIGTPESVLSSLMHSFVWMLKNHVFFTFFFFHMLYFYLICFYLRIKLSGIIDTLDELSNKRRKERRPRDDAIKVYHLLLAIKNVQTEIRQFNGTFWSMAIFFIWSGFIVNIAAFLITTLFGDLNFMVRIICCLVLGLEMIGITMLCMIASSVNSKSSKLFFSLYRAMIYLDHLPTRIRFKMSVWCEITSKQKMGFTCGSLFQIRYMTYFEMVAFTASLFLKLLQFLGEYD